MYVCGPTVYGEAHLGHARSAVVFDLLYRYLQYSSYAVRYVRNITDVGHLENELEEEGEDKLVKQSKIENKEPMELAQFYSNSFRASLTDLNVLSPSIEPLATGHIPEQLEYITKLIDCKMAYVSNGSVYFDMEQFLRTHAQIYGSLSRVSVKDMQESLHHGFQQDKKSSLDFALWKKADENHIMKWNSPWTSAGFPGWHTECIAMSEKYLGIPFDIHGGGLDLQFPHHEAEIAQAYSLHQEVPARFWIYNNMITIKHQKMSKSLGNFITLDQCFSGEHAMLHKAYSPNVLRFFLLRSHYRSILDFTDESLQGAEKGLDRLLAVLKKVQDRVLSVYLPAGAKEKTFRASSNKTYLDAQMLTLMDACKKVQGKAGELRISLEQHMNNDLDSPALIAELFVLAKRLEATTDTTNSTEQEDEVFLVFYVFCSLVLGLDARETNNNEWNSIVDTLMVLRKKAREEKNFAFSDYIRDALLKAKIKIKDRKDGTSYWEY